MHEDLVGYLLGALEPDEMARVAKLLRESPEARAELERIEKLLQPLEEADPPPAPGSDLVARTLDNLPPLPSPGEPNAESAASVSLAPMGSRVENSGRSTMSWLDWVSGSVAVAILLGLLLPAIAQGRFESRRAACEDQLRQFGPAFTFFVMRGHQNRLPEVPADGREAFAGVYALRLHDAGLLPDGDVRWCPSVDPPSESQRKVGQLVSLSDLHSASVSHLKKLQRVVGGHYAYTLGVVDEKKHTAPRFKSRSTFAVMSDAPIESVSGGVVRSEQFGHGGRGINVLFEDGHTGFFSLEVLTSMTDNPLQNHRGDIEAGVDADDASLGASWQAPFLNVLQH